MAGDQVGSNRPANRAILEGILLKAPEIRIAPSGRCVASLEVEHLSQIASESERTPALRLELHMSVVAAGPLAEWCRQLGPGTPLRVAGFLNQRRWIRDGVVRWGQTELVARQIQIAAHDGHPAPAPNQPTGYNSKGNTDV